MNKRLLIGIVTAECHVDFQAETLKGIISQAFKSNCDAAVISSFHNFFSDSSHKEQEKEIFRLLLSDRFDGFLYDRNTFFSEKIRSYIDDLLERSKKPVMLLDSGDHRIFESTAIDDRSAFEEITDHLIDVHGFRKIYCLTGPKKQFVSEERLGGFRLSMKKHGITVGSEHCIYGDFWVNAAKELAADIISGRISMPEAVVCGNDHSAISLISALMEGGIRVPEDIAVTGYDDSAEGRDFTPSVTSLRRPNFQLGAEAFRRLYRIITGKICVRVSSQHVTLRTGESCGCGDHGLELPVKKRRSAVMKAQYMTQVLRGDMLFDISGAESPEKFIDRLDNYTYCIYKLRHMYICLTRSFLESGSTGAFSADTEMKAVLRKKAVTRVFEDSGYFPASEILPVYGTQRQYPCAYYITPLHCGEHFFGYGALSFGKEPISYDELYIYWTNYVNAALERLRVTCEMKRELDSASRRAFYDSATGLLNRNGIEKRISERPRISGERLCFVRIQLTSADRLYYSGGENRYRQVISDFGGLLEQCTREEEIWGLWGEGIFALVSSRPDREKELFKELSAKVRAASTGTAESSDMAFSIGVYCSPEDSIGDVGSFMHRAAVNRVSSYTAAETGSNPQFEKLCHLRERIAENPELPWNISDIAKELYLSKSYLQKIYKTYFGKGIIEEMTQFRLEKAKELLVRTEMTVTEIAKECGYSTYNYFVRRFRAEEGVSPNEYRTKQ